MLERIRRKTGKSLKHWFITEKGHESTERLHIHGIVWGIGSDKLVEEKWSYGITFTGTFVNRKNNKLHYKIHNKNRRSTQKFQGKILCSAGIGANYVNRGDAYKHTYKKEKQLKHTD